MKKIIFFFAFLLAAFVFAFPLLAQPQDTSLDNNQAPSLKLEPPDMAGEAKLALPQDQKEVAPSLSAPAEDASKEPAKIVKAIEIKGNKTIGIPTILSKIKTRVGEEYLQNIISDDLKRLYNTGYFADVSVDHEDYESGFKVIIYLVEKPIVEKITFTKTRYFNPRTLLLKIKTKEGQFLDNRTLKEDLEILKDLYVKKGLTSVNIDSETDTDKTANKAKLHIIIEEGTREKIKRIVFDGNKTFRHRKLMSIIKTRSDTLLNSGYLKEDILKEDIERIKSFYEKQGFIDAGAEYTLEYKAKSRIICHILIKEGSRYYVGNIAVSNNQVLTTDEILKAMKEIKAGKVFSRDKLEVDTANIRTLYFDRGYIFANIKESTSLSPATGKVDIALDVAEGEMAYVNKIKIQGNTRTRDIVVRREIRLQPGDRFDGEKLRRSKERLRNLGYFEDISYDTEDTDSPNKKDLVVQVKEAKTGTLSFGGGYSTVDKIVGFVEVEQKNFDFTSWPTFTGGGQDLVIHAEAGSVRNNTRLSFTEPWLFDYPISGGFDIYQTKRLRESDVGYGYDEKRVGGDLRFGKQLSEYLSAGASFRNESIRISNLDTNATADLVRELGTNVVRSVSFRLTRDTRDNLFNPTKGLLLSGSTEVAGGMLGGDKDFTKLEGRASYDLPVFFNSVLEFRLQGGAVKAYDNSELVPIFERFFAGGAYTIRGYNERKVGPLDGATNDPIGGESMVIGNIELIVPIIDFIKVAGFFDTGNVWSKVRDIGQGGYKSGTGLGLRVKTPIGPINLDYGYPLNDEPGETSKSGKFYFSVSRGF